MKTDRQTAIENEINEINMELLSIGVEETFCGATITPTWANARPNVMRSIRILDQLHNMADAEYYQD